MRLAAMIKRAILAITTAAISKVLVFIVILLGIRASARCLFFITA